MINTSKRLSPALGATLGRLTAKVYSDGNRKDFTYDIHDRITKASDNHSAYSYQYDKNDNILAKIDTKNSSAIYYKYDALSQRTKMTAPGLTQSYQYDALGQLIYTEARNAKEKISIAYHYNASGTLEHKEFSTGLRTAYQYDALNQITQIENQTNNKALSSYSYTYDKAGNRITEIEQLNSKTVNKSFRYDSLNRLTHADYGNNEYETFSYSATGNRLKKMTHEGTTSYSYDSDNRLLSEQFNSVITRYTYDQAGRLIMKQAGNNRENFSYDARDLMTKYTRTESTAMYQTDYAYDVLNQRISKATAGKTTRFTFDGDNILSENEAYLVNNLQVNGYEGRLDNFILTAYTKDAMGSVTGEVTKNTLTVKSYLAYGSLDPSVQFSPGVENHSGSNLDGGQEPLIDKGQLSGIAYTGHYYDSESGLYYARNRYYDPGIGRFTERDLIDEYTPNGLNKYMYAGNNPVIYWDPLGLRPRDDDHYTDNSYVHYYNDINNTYGNFNYGRALTDPSYWFDQSWSHLRSEFGYNSFTDFYGKNTQFFNSFGEWSKFQLNHFEYSHNFGKYLVDNFNANEWNFDVKAADWIWRRNIGDTSMSKEVTTSEDASQWNKGYKGYAQYLGKSDEHIAYRFGQFNTESEMTQRYYATKKAGGRYGTIDGVKITDDNYLSVMWKQKRFADEHYSGTDPNVESKRAKLIANSDGATKDMLLSASDRDIARMYNVVFSGLGKLGDAELQKSEMMKKLIIGTVAVSTAVLTGGAIIAALPVAATTTVATASIFTKAAAGISHAWYYAGAKLTTTAFFLNQSINNMSLVQKFNNSKLVQNFRAWNYGQNSPNNFWNRQYAAGVNPWYKTSSRTQSLNQATSPKLLAKPNIIKHHIFNKFRGSSPQSAKYREFFKKHGIQVDKYTVEITEGMHKKFIHKGGNNWTTRWKQWIDSNPNATTTEVYQFGGSLMDEYGLSGLPLVDY